MTTVATPSAIPADDISAPPDAWPAMRTLDAYAVILEEASDHVDMPDACRLTLLAIAKALRTRPGSAERAEDMLDDAADYADVLRYTVEAWGLEMPVSVRTLAFLVADGLEALRPASKNGGAA